jgi:hypothetical protein
MFTKIKHKAGETILEWTDSSEHESVVHSLRSHEDPRPEFLTALQALTSVVLSLCELPLDYGTDLKITGVTITDHETLGRGTVITALKKLTRSQAPLVLNTPHITETGSHENAPTLFGRELDLLEQLQEEASRYLKGERAQQSLFDQKAA